MCTIKPDFLWIKAILYRIIRIVIVLFSAWFISGNIEAASEIAAFDAVIATIYYWYFDKIWCKIELKLQKFHLWWKYRKLN